jgi:hypothetical protein
MLWNETSGENVNGSFMKITEISNAGVISVPINNDKSYNLLLPTKCSYRSFIIIKGFDAYG